MDWAHLCIVLTGGLVLWRVLKWLHLRLFYDIYRLPTPKGELPIVGHWHVLPLERKPRISKYILDQTLVHGKIWRFSIFGRDHVIVTDREYFISHIYGAGDKAEPKAPTYKAFQKLGGDHGVPSLFTSEAADEKYKAFRKTLAVAFSSDNLKKKFPALAKKAYEAADVVDESIGKAIDYQHLGIHYAFDSVGIFAYNVDLDSLKKGHPLLSALHICAQECILDAIIPMRKILRYLFPFLDMAKRAKSEFNTLYHEYNKLYNLVDLVGDAPGEDDKSIRACLMRLRNPLRNNEKANQDEIMSEFTTFTFAGTDTTGHQIGWAMMWIADKKEVQDKMYRELKAEGLAGAGARKVEYSDLPKLTYLKMVIMEIMRKTPSAPGRLIRQIRSDMTVMGYRLPKGTLVGACVLAQNNAPWLWKDPEVFRPERWAKEDGVDGKRESKARGTGKELWTFGAGVRDCVGQRLAMMELQMMIAVLLSKFTFELDPRMGGVDGALKQAFNSLVQVCDGGMWVRAERRSDNSPSISTQD